MQDEIYMDMFQDDNEAPKDGKILASCPALTQSNELTENGPFLLLFSHGLAAKRPCANRG